MFSEADNYYFGRASQWQQSKFNRTNAATILRTVEKSHNPQKKEVFDQIYFRKTFLTIVPILKPLYPQR